MSNEDVSKYLKNLKEIKKPPSKWTVDEMIENLSKCQLNFFRKKFKDNEIDGKKFLKMKEFATFLSSDSDCEEILNYQIALQTIEKKIELEANDDDRTLKYNKKKKNQTDSDENDSKSKFKKNKKKITDSDEEEEEEEEEINQKKPMDKNKEGKTREKNRKKIPSKEESDDSEKNPKPILKTIENHSNNKKKYINSEEEEENIKLKKNIIKDHNIPSKIQKNKKHKTDSEEEEEYKNSEEEEQNEDSEENNIKDFKKKKNSQSSRSSSSQSSRNEKSKKNTSSEEKNIKKKKTVTIDDDLKSKLQENIKKKTDFEEAEENSTKLRELIKKKNMSITLNKKGKKNSDEENDSSHSSQKIQHVRNSSSSQEELKEEITKTKIKKEIKDSSDNDSNNENPENIDNEKKTKCDRQIQNIEDQATQPKEKKKMFLTLVDQDKNPIEIETSCKIGSSLDGNLRITSVTSKKISINYADIIFINNGNYLIKDDKSPNGLFISVVPGTEIKLSNNMCFKVGSTFFKIISIEKNLLKIGIATNQNFNDMQIKSSEFGEKQKIVLGKNPAKLPSFKFIDFPNDDNFDDIQGIIYCGDVENMFLLNALPSKKGFWFKLQKTDNNSEYPFVKLFPRIKILFSDKNIYTVKNVNVVDLKLCSKCQKTAKSIYLPCLHSVYCFDCAKNERNCEECNKKIKSVEEIIDFTYN